MKKSILSFVLLLSFVWASAGNFDYEPYEHYELNANTEMASNVNSFCKLIQSGDFNTVKTLIKQGEDVNGKSMGLTPLMFAARHNRADIAKLLIDNGAKLNSRSDKDHLTALEYAERSKANDAYAVIESAIETKKNKKKK